MKKLVLVVLVLFMIGATAFAQQTWGVTNQEGGRPSATNTAVVRNNGYIYFYLLEGSPVPGRDFDRVRIEMTADNPVNLYWMCAYVPGAVLGSHRGGQNRSTWHYENMTGNIVIETDCAGFIHPWYGNGPLVKSNITGFCVNVGTSRSTTFTITNVSFIGLR